MIRRPRRSTLFPYTPLFRSLLRRLRELPEEAAQPYGWREFQRRALARTRPAQRLAGGRALATASVLALGIIAVWARLGGWAPRSEEHTSELQSQSNLVCRLL